MEEDAVVLLIPDDPPLARTFRYMACKQQTAACKEILWILNSHGLSYKLNKTAAWIKESRAGRLPSSSHVYSQYHSSPNAIYLSSSHLLCRQQRTTNSIKEGGVRAVAVANRNSTKTFLAEPCAYSQQPPQLRMLVSGKMLEA